MLGRALSPILDIKRSEQALEDFGNIFSDKYTKLMSAKLGLAKEEENDLTLIKHLLDLLETQGLDYTAFFRALSHYNGDRTDLLELCGSHQSLTQWLNDYDKRLLQEVADDRNRRMLKINPKYILKNYILQEAIDKAEKGDNSLVNELLKLAQNPYEEHPEFDRYAKATPSKYQNLRLSCSS
jgi:uncharacterized protein YdiU (UPF0061 family)